MSEAGPSRLHDQVKTILGERDTPRPDRARLAALALAAALVLLGAAGGYAIFANGLFRADVAYGVDAVRRGSIRVIVTATGTVEPTNTVEVSSELSGIIRKVKVDYNTEVAAGDVLAELDTDKLKAELEVSRARLQAAKAYVLEAQATVVEAEQDLQRSQRLAERRVIAGQELDAARATHDRALASLERARADVTAAEADLRLNETELAKSCICSPIRGVVLNRNVEPGQVVAATLQAPVLFTIAEDLTRMEVWVDVDEADVGAVAVGQTAKFTVDAYPDRMFEARIRELRYGSEVVQGVVTYKAVLTADNPDLLLRPGMTATAEIVVGEATDVLTVSNEALRFSPSVAETSEDSGGVLERLLPGRPHFRAASRPQAAGPERRLWILRDGAPEAIDVTVGATDGNRTEVVDGPLSDGQEVIVDETGAGS